MKKDNDESIEENETESKDVMNKNIIDLTDDYHDNDKNDNGSQRYLFRKNTIY